MKRVVCWIMFVLLLVGVLRPATADEFRPAYLQLTQVDASTYDLLWKLPALDEATTLRLRPEFPAGTQVMTPVQSGFANGTATQRWRIAIDGGLAGQAVRFPDLAQNRVDVLVRLERLDGTTQLGRVLPLAPAFAFTASPGSLEVANTYTVLGIEHILTGFDHLLFVLALLILVTGTRRLIATITAFTVGHSVTLAAASLGFVQVPGPPLEAAIALSIMFVAAEILHSQQGRLGLTQRYPWLVAVSFGLLHGLGFAGALAEVGLPPLSIPVALLFFNIGVEIGQLLFVLAVFALGAIARSALRDFDWRRLGGLRRMPPYVIGAIAGFWFIQRVAAF